MALNFYSFAIQQPSAKVELCTCASNSRISLASSKDLNTVCALIFAGLIFRGFAIFAFFAFLNLRLLDTVVLKYSRVKYSRIYGVSPYTIVVYGSCRGAQLAGLVVGFV